MLKRVISILCMLTMLITLVPTVYGEENSYTYLGDLYTVTSANSANTYAFTDTEARTGDISLHMVHTSGTSDAITFAIPASAKTGMHFLAWGGYGYAHFKFYAKGTLPESAALQVAWSNGTVNATKTITDWAASGITVGEEDENGWRAVDIRIECKPSNAGSYGGWASVNLNVTGAADFYMDDVNFDYEIYNSAGAYQSSVTGLLDDYDPSFENVEAAAPPPIAEEWEDLDYTDEDKESLTLLNDIFTVSGETDENWGAFREDEAYDGDVALHLVHKKTNTDTLTLQIGNGTAALQGLGDYATNMSATVKFYAKGHIPDTASYTLGMTNGRLKCTPAERSAWIVGEEDENGWKLVTINISGNYDSGFHGGYMVSSLNITGQTDMYIDKLTLDWTQGGNSAELLSKYGLDGSFEDVFRTVEWEDTEYSYDDKKSMVIESGMYTVSTSNSENWGSFRTDDAYDGSISLHMVHPKTNTDTLTLQIGKGTADLQNVASSVTSSMTGTLKFYAKGNLPDAAVLRMTMTNGRLTYNVPRALWTVGEEDENGWRLVTVSGTGSYSDGFYGGYVNVYLDITSQADFYMDSLSLDWAQGGNTGEILSVHQPSFEDAVEVVVMEQDYAPTNLYVYPTESSLMLSWRNAKSDSLKSVKLYDITDEEEVDLTEAYEVNQGEAENVNLKIADLEKGVHRYYMLVSSFEDHEDTYFTFGAKTEAGSYPAVSGWSRETYSNKLGYTPIKPYIYTGEAHSGNASLRVISNQENPVPGNNYVTFMANAGVSADKKYQFSFWTKGDVGRVQFYSHWSAMDGKSEYSISYDKVSDWHQEVWTLTAPQTTTIRMNFERGNNYFLVDDIELYELDADGNTVGSNLISNGGFESGIDAGNIPSLPDDITASAETAEVINLSWKTINDSGNKVNIYKKSGEDYVLQAVVLNDRNNIDIKGLVCDEENILAVSVTNSADIESEKYEITVVPKSFDYEVGEVRLTKGKKTIAALTAGDITVKTAVKNNHMGSGFTAELIGALYKDGVLVKVFADGETEIPELPSYYNAEEVEMTASIPDLSDGEYTMEVFIWDSYETGRVLSKAVTFTE